jgi:predicted Fe-S protein YdhL (DUF1289 family)
MEKNISPCNGTCRYGSDNLCIGCYRSVEEISLWTTITEKEKIDILNKIKERKALKMSYYNTPLG